MKLFSKWLYFAINLLKYPVSKFFAKLKDLSDYFTLNKQLAPSKTEPNREKLSKIVSFWF